jgi:hypothetical protein
VSTVSRSGGALSILGSLAAEPEPGSRPGRGELLAVRTGSELLLIEGPTPQQKKALIRLLVKELRVASREEIMPTYKVPSLVRAPEGRVDLPRRR